MPATSDQRSDVLTLKYDRGDAFQALVLTFTQSAVPINLTGSTFRATFRANDKRGRILKQITDGAGITLTDLPNGVITIDAFSMDDWDMREIYFDIEKDYDSPTARQTYVRGTIVITQDVSP